MNVYGLPGLLFAPIFNKDESGQLVILLSSCIFTHIMKVDETKSDYFSEGISAYNIELSDTKNDGVIYSCKRISGLAVSENQEVYYSIAVYNQYYIYQNHISTSIFKANSNLQSSECSPFNISYEGLDKINMTAMQFSFSSGYSNQTTIHLAENHINFKYFDNLDLFKDYNGIAEYKELDVTSCLWPNYIYDIQSCDPENPPFLLQNSYSIKVAENNPQNLTYLAFQNCRNSRFMFRICTNIPSEDTTCITPEWISVNQLDGNFIIDTSKVTSAGINHLMFQSKLFGVSFSGGYYLDNISDANSTSFEFINDNCVFANSKTENWYIILNKMKNTTITFSDNENDTITLKLDTKSKILKDCCKTYYSEDIRVFIQKQSNLIYNLLMQCDDSSVVNSTIVIQYTDRYHKDAQYWRETIINVNVFKTEPPQFASELNKIVVSMCSINQQRFMLPSIVDTDSSKFSISLANDSPDWVQVEESTQASQLYYISIDNSSPMIPNISSNINVTLILSDDSGAFTSYILSIDIQLASVIRFQQFANIEIDQSKSVEIPLDFENQSLSARFCGTQETVSWICYSGADKALFINDADKCRFDNDKCDNNQLLGIYCIEIGAINSCYQVTKSNEFNITITPAKPPAIINTIPPIYVYANHYVEVKLPEDLFDNNNKPGTIYKTSNCIDENHIKIATRTFEDYKSGTHYLFVKVYGDVGCQISIYNQNSNCQTSEIKVDITVLKCASKDCFECSGPYESDCITCNSGFIISNDGSCVRDVGYLPIINVKLYWICGLFAMIVTFIHVFLTIRYGKFMLKPIINIQSLMMLVLSSNCVNEDWKEYFSWIQFFKLDLGIINSYSIKKIIQCTTSSGKYANVELYCQEAIINYSFPIILIVIALFCKWILKYQNKFRILSIFCCLKMSCETMLWTLSMMILPFFSISMYYDLATIQNHYASSFFSILILIIIVIYCVLNKMWFFKPGLIQKIDPFNSLTYIYLNLLSRVSLVMLFLFDSNMGMNILLVVIIVNHCSIVLVLIIQNNRLPFHQNFNRATDVFCNSVMLLVILVISMEKFANQSSVNCSANSFTRKEISTSSLVVLLMTSMFLCFLLIAVTRIISEFITKKIKN